MLATGDTIALVGVESRCGPEARLPSVPERGEQTAAAEGEQAADHRQGPTWEEPSEGPSRLLLGGGHVLVFHVSVGCFDDA